MMILILFVVLLVSVVSLSSNSNTHYINNNIEVDVESNSNTFVNNVDEKNYSNSNTNIIEAQSLLKLAYKYLKNDINQRSLSSSILPTITISFAQTLDGSIAPLSRARLDISSKCSFKLLHSLRSCHDGVLVGINTVIFDQPRLNVRDALPDTYSITNNINIDNQPRPIIIDSNLKILDIDINNIKLINPIICTCIDTHDNRWKQANEKLTMIGATLVHVKADENGRCDIVDSLKIVKEQCNIQSILIEGGANIIQSTLENRLANQIVLTLRPSFFGGYKSMTKQLAAPVELENITVASIEGDIVIHGIVSKKDEGTSMNVNEYQQTRERVTLQ